MTDTSAPLPSATRPVYWTIRRELWENRSIYLAPAIVGGLEMAAILISTLRHHHDVQIEGDIKGIDMQVALGAIYGALGLPILITALIVAAFYCLDALYSERRDRSILFWKSLPVSDTVTVLAKALVPLIILPVITLVMICVTQMVGLMSSALILRLNGVDASFLWVGVPVATMPVILAYALAAMSLWYAPLYGWLFLVSAFARRKAILWAVLPPLGLCLIEKLAFQTNYFPRLLADRFIGFLSVAFLVEDPHHAKLSLDKLTPGDLLGASGLWIGLAVAALFFTAAIQLRRYRGPV